MKKVLLIVLLISSFCLPSAGQMFVIDEQGKVYDGYGDDLSEELFRYRVINDRYPNDKKELLDFMLDKDRAKCVDSVYLSYFNERNNVFSKLIKKRRNTLTVSGDTCTFYIAKDRYTIRCVGGIADLLKYDTDQVRFWTSSRFYDRNGKYLWSLGDESPSLPKAINNLKKRFGYVVTMAPTFFYDSPLLDYGEDDILIEFRRPWTPPVMIPFTMTRNGDFSYDLSCLDGIQLYYNIYGKRLVPANRIGTITLEEAIDPDYLDTVKAYMEGFMAEHEEVGRMCLWELVLLKHPPVVPLPKISIFCDHIRTIAQQEGISFREAATKVKEIGYEGVDMNVLQALENSEEARILDSLGFRFACAIADIDYGAGEQPKKEERVMIALQYRRNYFDQLLLVPGLMPEGSSAEDMEAVRARIAAFVLKAREEGFPVLVEDYDNPRSPCYNTELLDSLFALSPKLGLVFDTGNFIFAGEDALESLAHLSEYIGHVHMKDRVSPTDMRCVPAGTGCVPIRQIVQTLVSEGYSGWLTVEQYGSLQMLADCRTAFDNVTKMLDESR
jgi:sugar phosphate isomerase/epimerase